MNASSLDLLEKSDLPAGQARAILQAMDTELVLRNYATKDDIKASEAKLLLAMSDLRREIAAMGTKLALWSGGFLLAAAGLMLGVVKWLQ